ncbi:MAG: radical protein [Myxococcaceae bacterium]|nr:radical protein [Myxococcaceae bacterium]
MRRSVSNPRNPWHEAHVELLGPAPQVELQIFEIAARSILSKNDSPDLSFTYSLNPYQGCYHGCAYCYARPSHQYLGFGAGTDFERKLLVKTNAPELLRTAFSRRGWTGETVVMSGNTDCYQPLEASYELTRRCIQTFVAFKNPLAIITKGGVIHRDIALLGELARLTSVQVFVTIPFLDDDVRRAVEPFAAPIESRFEAVRKLSELGVITGVSLSPIIPGLNDSDVPELLERARAAGASQAMMSLLRLPGEVKQVFFERIGATLHPKRVEKITHAITEMRGGSLDEPRFGRRFHGQGKRWQMVEQLFELQCRKLGLQYCEPTEPKPMASTFQRPKRQLTMFE